MFHLCGTPTDSLSMNELYGNEMEMETELQMEMEI
jgi:hypothetical protein